MTSRFVAGVIVAALAAAAAAPSPAQTAGRRYALLIGVNAALQPGIRKLNFVDDDVRELESLLKRQGYEVRTIPNDRGDRERIINELYRHALSLTELDTFVLYFAGHGVRNVEVNRKTYWLTDDADLRMLDVHGIRLEHLLSYVDDIRAVRKLILLDHCFSGDVAGLTAPTPTLVAPPPPPAAPPAPEAPEASVDSRKASVVIFSEVGSPRRDGTTIIAAARDEAFELPTIGHGVFTKALLDACSSADGDSSRDSLLSVMELIVFLQPRVDQLLEDAPPQVLVDKLPTGGAAMLQWRFCTLPVPSAEVGGRVAQLQTALHTWETKGLLTPVLRNAATSILDKWRNAEGDAARLSDREQRVLVAIRLSADATDLTPERARVTALLDVLRREGY
ncbi:MAG: caspase family protein [Acidobacteria bacterium]|nr:caspase family protein [Acidobacteriota bacterium]